MSRTIVLDHAQNASSDISNGTIMKIAFFDIEDWEVEHIKKNIKGHELKFFKESISKNNISLIKNYDAIASFIYAKLDKKILDRLPKLKLIATMSTGYDHIDLKECNKRKIMVCNVPYYGENTVAEHTFALILALSRKIYPSIQRTKMGLFDVNGLRGFDLKDKTIGLIGTGHISFHVARIAKGFEMKIIGYDIRLDMAFKIITSNGINNIFHMGNNWAFTTPGTSDKFKFLFHLYFPFFSSLSITVEIFLLILDFLRFRQELDKNWL